MAPPPQIRSAEVVLPCRDLEATLAFFTERLSFRVAAIFPADHPRVAVLTGHGLRLRLEAGREGPPGEIRLACDEPRSLFGDTLELLAPDGTRVTIVPAEPEVVVPALRPSFVLERLGPSPLWGQGRAGMSYRDLIPGRQGGRFIASHILIREGGPVPDYVHFHRVRFQMIYCAKGSVRVVYEDQGPPFVMEAGDCVLQPPRIRHRVLECSPGLEVIEISCPAEHETLADLDLELPTAEQRPERDFSGQRFVWHRAAQAAWTAPAPAGFEARDLGIAAATSGLAGVRVLRPRPGTLPVARRHEGELQFCFVLQGTAMLMREGAAPEGVGAGDSFVVPPGLSHTIDAAAPDLELFEVSVPGVYSTS